MDKIFGNFFKDSWQNNLIKIAVVVAVLLIIRRFINKGLAPPSDEEVIYEQNLSLLENVCQGNIATNDNTDNDTLAYNFEDNTTTQFDSQSAVLIAQLQYDGLQGWNPNEKAVLQSVANLNGRALQLVFCEFGLKDNKNLIQWYQEKLKSFASMIYWAENLDTTDAFMPDCESYLKQCNEVEAMKSIWLKSGLNWN